MKPITEFNFRKLHADELGAFAHGLIAALADLRAATCIPEPLAERFERTHLQYNQSMGRKIDRAGTQRSKELNTERNNLIRSIRGAIQMAKFRTPELQEAAKRVEEALRRRGWNIHRQGFDAKTNSIKLLMGDVSRSEALQAAMATIRCDDLLRLLDEANDRFVESEGLRREQKGAQKGIGAKSAKAALCNEISRILGYLSSVAGIYPEVDLAIRKINLQIDPLAARIKGRATHARRHQQPTTTAAEVQAPHSSEPEEASAVDS